MRRNFLFLLLNGEVVSTIIYNLLKHINIMKNKSSTLKSVALVLLQAFLLQQIAFAAPGLSITDLNLFGTQSLKLSFNLPESIATVDEVFKSDNKSGPWSLVPGHQNNDKVIILIKDAHTNESGQLNLFPASLDTEREVETQEHTPPASGPL